MILTNPQNVSTNVTQADINRKFLLFVIFCVVKGPFYLVIQLVGRLRTYMNSKSKLQGRHFRVKTGNNILIRVLKNGVGSFGPKSRHVFVIQ